MLADVWKQHLTELQILPSEAGGAPVERLCARLHEPLIKFWCRVYPNTIFARRGM